MTLVWVAEFVNHRVTIENDDSSSQSLLISSSGFVTKFWCEIESVAGKEIRNYYLGGSAFEARSKDQINDIIKKSSMRTTISFSESNRSLFIHINRCSENVYNGIEWVATKRSYIIDPMFHGDIIGITNKKPENPDQLKNCLIGFKTYENYKDFPKFFQNMGV